ncbi:hypothetical protein AC244_00370 [Ensifer adhaerens]|uniref:Uncharacterized protein n=1 Tax=Ensifer adhaerens TaxID=106592 RepID=A0A0L8C543_ENSAD|nr:hypothetical protein [Ensifer adhaerens]KOF22062.1 hypothetical protein AC244_00370 [Ensifer adhaerens]
MLLALALLTSLLTDQPILPNPQGSKAVPDYFNNRSDQPVVPNPRGNTAIPDYFKNNQMGGGQPGFGGGQPGVTICNLNGQDRRGQFKICRYDCGTEITIDQRIVCPFIQQR